MIWLILIFIELYYCIVVWFLRALVCSYACQVLNFFAYKLYHVKMQYIKKIIKICL